MISIEGTRYVEISAQFSKDLSEINPIDIRTLK